jgi:hypothetical protein
MNRFPTIIFGAYGYECADFLCSRTATDDLLRRTMAARAAIAPAGVTPANGVSAIHMQAPSVFDRTGS